ncbi:MAG: hypothetical protein MHM6MM_006043 [Cercozoa sp. M6MM]
MHVDSSQDSVYDLRSKLIELNRAYHRERQQLEQFYKTQRQQLRTLIESKEKTG